MYFYIGAVIQTEVKSNMVYQLQIPTVKYS